ncbi:hypothetical protein ACFVQ3_12650 [Oerskovia sp. NPDC057915]|uniref:hypothetical protein n=1 Tax=Oerskovia sp. NPDC057915 TaxID=3346280 RepID=UPI0036DC5BF7
MRRGTAGLVLAGVLLVGGCTAVPEPHETPLVETTVTVVVPEQTGPSEIRLRPDGAVVAERATGPAGAADLLGGLLADDERFGTVRLDGSGTVVLVWHGDPPQEALAVLAEAHPDVLVHVEPIDVLPGDLQRRAESLLGDDLSSIVVQVGHEPNPLTLARRLTTEVGFPVEVEVEVGAP